MKFIPTEIEGAWLIVPEPIEDERGSFARIFSMHASDAAYTKATILRRAPLTPKASAISSPPLSARMARPGRESSRLSVAHNAASAMVQIR